MMAQRCCKNQRIMDLLATIQDSSDEDFSRGSDCVDSRNPTSDFENSAAAAKKQKHQTTPRATSNVAKGGLCQPSSTTTGSCIRRNKKRRIGSVNVISSNDSVIFSRSVPHRRGSWSGHVKIPLSSSNVASLRKLKKCSVEKFRNVLERRGISGTIVEHGSLHVSLSKYFSLQIAQIEPFVRRLADLIRQEHSMSLHVETKTIMENDDDAIDEIVILNEEKSRSFWCWKVRPNATLLRLVTHIDSVLKKYNQPVYYQPARFHISVASYPGNIMPTEDLEVVADIDEDVRSRSKRNDNDNNTFATTTSNGGSVGDTESDDEDDEISSSSSSAFDESLILPVLELHCTFGTSKEFIMPLRS